MAAGLLIAFSVGASFTGSTVTVKVRENAASSVLFGIPSGPASRTVTTICAVPLRLATGVNRSEPVALGVVYVTVGFGIRPALLEVAVIDSACVSPGPAEMPARSTVCWAASSEIVVSLIGSSVGGALPEL